MKSFRRRTARLLIGIAAASVACAPTPAGAEFTIAEEELAAQLLAGDADAARRGFQTLIDQRLAAARATDGDDEIQDRSALITRAALALAVWQSTETNAELRGIADADTSAAAIVSNAEALHAELSALARAGTRASVARVNAAGMQTDYGRALDHCGATLLATVAFARDRVAPAKRDALLAKVRSFADAPPDVTSFDAAHPDPNALLRVAPPQSDRTPRAARRTERRESIEAGDPLFELGRALFDALAARNRPAAEALLADGYRADDVLDAGIERFGAARIVDLGPATARRVGGGEFEVVFDAIAIEDSTGQPVTLRSTWIATRKGGARITRFGADREEERP